MSDYINNLTQAITAMHECRCKHFGTEYVREEHNGELVWEGDVEIFHLEGHPEANVAYGWGWDDDGTVDYIGILNVIPVDSPQNAVKAAIASGKF